MPSGSTNRMFVLAPRVGIAVLCAVALAVASSSAEAATLKVGDASGPEGTGGFATLNFKVRASAHQRRITVHYATAPASATSPADYAHQAGDLTFPPDKRRKTVRVEVVTDGDVEPEETFSLELSDPRRARITDGEGLGTIVNDDVEPGCFDAATAAIEGSNVGNLTNGCGPGGPDAVPSCAVSPGKHQWWSFTVPAGQAKAFTVDATGDLGFALFTANDSGQELECEDQQVGGSPETASYTNQTASSLTIYIQVFAFEPGEEGSYTLGIASV